MRRCTIEPRPNFHRLVQSQGLVYSTVDAANGKEDYWPDDRCYSFTSAEIDLLERASKDVFDMLCEAAEWLVGHPDVITEKMAIPAFALKMIKETWDREPAFGSVYSRFDVCFGGLDHPDERLRVPKFYEFNADTPTSLVESCGIQWLWLEQTGHGNDQFNLIFEKLIDAWKRNLDLVEKDLGHKFKLHFAVSDLDSSGEDAMNTTLLMNACQQAGYQVKPILMEDISQGPGGRFFDRDNEHIDVIFKLYPWEFILEDDIGKACFLDMENKAPVNGHGPTLWIEAPYKLLWSNKAIFAILWDLFKDDPRSKWLLPTYFDGEAPTTLTKYCRKPIFAREGADITLHDGDKLLLESQRLDYGREGFIIQELALLPDFKDDAGTSLYPVIGIWFVDGESAGMSIREDPTPVTSNISKFCPHSISDAPLNYERKPVPTIEDIEASLSIDNYSTSQAEDKKFVDVLAYVDSVVGNV